jgi:hypothetical protein
MNFRENIAEYVLGFLKPQQLIQVALNALEEGYDSTSLAMLAGESWTKDYYPHDVLRYFRDALVELNIELPSTEEAAHILIRYHANQIVSGKQDVFESLGAIYSVYHFYKGYEKDDKYVGDCLDITQLLAMYHEYDYLHEPWIEKEVQSISKRKAVQKINKEAQKIAREYLARHPDDTNN